MTAPKSSGEAIGRSLHPIVYVFGITAAVAGMLYGLGFGVS